MNSKKAQSLLEAIARGTSAEDACSSLGLGNPIASLEAALRLSSTSKDDAPLTITVKKRGGHLPLPIFEGFGTDTFSVKVTHGKRPKITLYPIASENDTPTETEEVEEADEVEMLPQMQQSNPEIRAGTPELARV